MNNPTNSVNKWRIEPATKEDRLTLTVLVLAMLEELQPFGHDMAATEANAAKMVDDLLLPAAANGDPVLIARDADGRAIGGLFWCRMALPPGQPSVAMGYGTYVAKRGRRQGIASELRKAGLAQLRQLGVQRMITSVLAGNIAGHWSLLKLGFRPASTIYLLNLQPPT